MDDNSHSCACLGVELSLVICAEAEAAQAALVGIVPGGTIGRRTLLMMM